MSLTTQAALSPPAGLPRRRLRLAAGTPAADAVVAVRDTIAEWQVPVDRALAAALASDLVINAAAVGADGSLMLVLRCTGRRFRVEVHDASVRGDSSETAAAGPQAQRGLLLAAVCAAASGRLRTPAGRASFYELEFPPPDAATGGGQPRRGPRGDGEP